MRKTMLSLVLAAAGAIGLAGSQPAAADSGRIYVGIGDVSFSYGRPYWRHNREPLYVVYERGYPRYYRYATPTYYAPPPVYYAPPVYTAYYNRGYDRRYHHRDRYDHHDRYDRRDHRRDHRRDRGDWD